MKLKTKLSGFTFLELVIIISIIGIGASVAIVSLNSSKSYAKLKAAQADTATAIKMAQSFALQGKTQSGEKACGYGFRFTDNQNYEIFYVKLDQSVHDSCGEQNGDANYRKWINDTDSPSSEIYNLAGEVSVKNPADIDNARIFFDIPHANIFNGKDGILLYAPMAIEFEYPPDSGNTKSITINELGSITEN